MLACNAAAVLAMLVALTQRDDMVVDATLRHYLARSTAAGARDEALSRLHSSAHTVRHPPLPPDDAFANALEDKRMGSSMADVPRSTLRAFMDPPRATLERAARGDVHAGVLGDSGEDELHVLLRARETRRDDGEKHEIERDAVNPISPLLAETCELQRAVLHSRGYGDVCRVRSEASDDRDANDDERADEQKTKSEDCVRPWSVLDARGAYDEIGLGNVVDALGALGARLADAKHAGAFERAQRTFCASSFSFEEEGSFEPHASSNTTASSETLVGGAGASLCADASFGVLCDKRGCDETIHPKRRRCVVAGFVEACALLGAMKVEDLRTLEAFHETTRSEAQRRLMLSDASSCDEWFAAGGTESTLVALRVGAAFRRWAEIESLRKESASIEDVIEDVTDTLRSPPPLAILAAPWSLLADATFGRDETKLTDKSSVPSLRATRVIFFLDGERDSNASGNDNLSPAARWVLDRAGPLIIEPFAHRTAQTKVAVSWHQVSASKSLQTAALWRDVRWAAGSLVITALLVAFHANDFRLAFGAMAAVSASLIAANYVYAFLLEIHWVGALNFLGCFVIFAIGADDVFVLVEFWRKSEKGMMPRDENNVVGRHHTTDASSMNDETDASSYRSQGLLRTRMRWTLAKSGYAVTMTSATTALAFAGNLASSVAPVRLFGAYMAALVACNYWLVCTSVPSLLVLAEKRKNKRGQLSFSREREQRQRVRQAETGGLLSSNVSRPPPRDDAPASPSTTPSTTPPASPSPSAPPLFPPPPSAARALFAGTSASTARPRDPLGVAIPTRRTATETRREPGFLRHRRTRSTATFETRSFLGGVSGGFSSFSTKASLDDGRVSDRPVADDRLRVFDRRASSLGGSREARGDVVLDVFGDFATDDDDGDGVGGERSFREFSVTQDSRSTPSSRSSIGTSRTSMIPQTGSLRSLYRFRDVRRRVSLELGAFATLRRGGAECVVVVAFACVLAAALAARRAAPPETASATATAFVEDANAKAFRVASEAFLDADGVGLFSHQKTRVAFVFGARDAGAPLRGAEDHFEARASSSNDDDDTNDDAWKTFLKDVSSSWTRPLSSFFEAVARGVSATRRRVSRPLRDPDVAVGGGGAPTAAPPAFDDAFDIAHPDTQRFLLRFCAELRALGRVAGDRHATIGARGDGTSGNETSAADDDGNDNEKKERKKKRVAEVSCFADALDARLRSLSGGRARLPLARASFESAARTVIPREDLAFAGLRWWRGPLRGAGGAAREKYTGDVATVEVTVATTTSPATESAKALASERAFLVAWFANVTKDAPASLGLDKGFVTSRTWALLDTEAELMTNAWSALGASLFCAFFVVLVAAQSATLAFLATVSVGAVAASFVAFLVMNGWRMGVAESTCVTVLVGLSLDYVLHVAGAYAEAPEETLSDKRARAFWATTVTAKSVFAGASTTVAAASFLLFKCDASFFKTFGAFVLWTASVSSVFASVVFPATCALWGPEQRRADGGDARRARRR